MKAMLGLCGICFVSLTPRHHLIILRTTPWKLPAGEFCFLNWIHAAQASLRFSR